MAKQCVATSYSAPSPQRDLRFHFQFHRQLQLQQLSSCGSELRLISLQPKRSRIVSWMAYQMIVLMMMMMMMIVVMTMRDPQIFAWLCCSWGRVWKWHVSTFEYFLHALRAPINPPHLPLRSLSLSQSLAGSADASGQRITYTRGMPGCSLRVIDQRDAMALDMPRLSASVCMCVQVCVCVCWVYVAMMKLFNVNWHSQQISGARSEHLSADLECHGAL